MYFFFFIRMLKEITDMFYFSLFTVYLEGSGWRGQAPWRLCCVSSSSLCLLPRQIQRCAQRGNISKHPQIPWHSFQSNPLNYRSIIFKEKKLGERLAPNVCSISPWIWNMYVYVHVQAFCVITVDDFNKIKSTCELGKDNSFQCIQLPF